MLIDWLAALEDLSVFRIIRTSTVLYALLNGTHILGFSLLLGSIAAFDLRLLGIIKGPAWRNLDHLLLVARIGFGIAVVTGLCLTALRITHYIQNPAFLFKMGALALSLGNVLAFTWVARLNDQHRWLKVSALLSLVLWITVLYAGRWIGFI